MDFLDHIITIYPVYCYMGSHQLSLVWG